MDFNDKLSKELLAECRRMADYILYNFDKAEFITDVYTCEERETLALRYLEHAKEGLWLIGSDGDQYMVLRAVRYLTIHANPSVKESTTWFREGLFVLLNLARPFAGTPPNGEPFFDDLRRGMAQAEAWGKKGSII